MDVFLPSGLGWQPDLPDPRDYRTGSQQVERLFADSRSAADAPPASVDLRAFFPPVCDQQGLPSSAAHACVALVEYFQRRATGESFEPSVLFLHQTAQRMAKKVSLPFADLRSHLKAMVTFGIPPTSLWPYDPAVFEKTPEADLYSFAARFRSVRYSRLDCLPGGGPCTLDVVKEFLGAGFPCVFGFSVPNALSRDADIPYRPTFDFVRGGQAVVAVGYDDNRTRSTRGALLVRASWGSTWGDQGYGWLPYAFVHEQLATCFWTLVSKPWLRSDEFARPKRVRPMAAAP